MIVSEADTDTCVKRFGLRCCVLLAVLGPATASLGSSRDPSQHLSPVTAANVGTPLSAAHAFRLGTAARPFAWSTALGDFNADGIPDVVIADRIARAPDGFGYRLEVAVSRVGSRTVAFRSRYPALRVRALDVDNDRDTDLVVEAIPTGAVVGVWINDGRGQFTEADTVRIQPEGLAPSQLADRHRAADPSACVGAHRADEVGASDSYRLPPPSARSRCASTRFPSSVRWLTLAADPRGPPAL